MPNPERRAACLPVLLLALFSFAPGCDRASRTPDALQQTTALALQRAFNADGRPTRGWIEAIRNRHDDAALDSIRATPRTPDLDELRWASLIDERVATWSGWIDSLSAPFGRVRLPDTVLILLGNSGGEDAFTPNPRTIAFDLGKLRSVYGEAGAAGNSDRIDRFFAHEMTHLLHKAWLANNPPALDTPLDVALQDCLAEGLGNYRSLSAKWVSADGSLTAQARATLDELEPIFVRRIVALSTAPPAAVDSLLDGLSSGPFAKKWGALTTALWLAQEAGGHDERLRQWVEAGPRGVLELAEHHLPTHLADEIRRIRP